MFAVGMEKHFMLIVFTTVKFGGGSVMVRGCMASSGTGMLYTCEGRMNSTIYTNILD